MLVACAGTPWGYRLRFSWLLVPRRLVR